MATVEPPPTSCADLRPRDADGPRTFDDALKRLGLADIELRAWVIRRLDRDRAWNSLIDGNSRYFWSPPSGSYVAIGYYEPNVHYNFHSAGDRREVVVRKGSIQFADHEYAGGMGTAFYRWITVPFPSTTSSSRTRTGQSRPAVCATCFTTLPLSGTCGCES